LTALISSQNVTGVDQFLADGFAKVETVVPREVGA
jgi:hypothetical protein